MAEQRDRRTNFYGSEIAETDEGNSDIDVEDEHREIPSRAAPVPETTSQPTVTTRTCFCNCKSACKTKQKEGKGRGCPCRTANLECCPNCKCGKTKPCANKALGIIRPGVLPGNSLDRQRNDIEAKKKEIQDFVNGLDDSKRKLILVTLLNNGRGSLDFAKRIIEEDPEGEPPTVNQLPWCICKNCVGMPTPEENKCCRRPECITSYELFSNLCLDRHVLEMAIRARSDTFVLHPDFSASSFRKAAYRMFILWEYGYLGKGNRRVIPSCTVRRIRAAYRGDGNEYMGFRYE